MNDTFGEREGCRFWWFEVNGSGEVAKERAANGQKLPARCLTMGSVQICSYLSIGKLNIWRKEMVVGGRGVRIPADEKDEIDEIDEIDEPLSMELDSVSDEDYKKTLSPEMGKFCDELQTSS